MSLIVLTTCLHAINFEFRIMNLYLFYLNLQKFSLK